MASFDELLQSTSFTLFVCFRLLGLSFGCRLSLPWPNRRIRVIAPYSQPLKGYVSRLLRISGIACCKQIHFREDGRGRKYADNSLCPPVPQPEPDQELLAELCRLPPLPEDQGGGDQSESMNAFTRHCRVRSMSLASSLRRTLRPFALPPGSRSGTSSERK